MPRLHAHIAAKHPHVTYYSALGDDRIPTFVIEIEPGVTLHLSPAEARQLWADLGVELGVPTSDPAPTLALPQLTGTLELPAAVVGS